MTRPPLSRRDYIEAAHEKGLEFVGSMTPSLVKNVTQWRCKNCGKTMNKSYRAVKYGANGCTCQNNVTLKAIDYTELAKILGIAWLDTRVPLNSKTMTRWQGPSGLAVEASYHQLAYGKIPGQLAHLLGLVEEDEPERETA